jgi:5-methyltetrahydrofolate--homocysteine methyltransferase
LPNGPHSGRRGGLLIVSGRRSIRPGVLRVKQGNPAFLERLARQVLIFDGAMGTTIHRMNLPLSDYRGHDNCSEILNETRPDAIEQIHRAFFEVGCDAVETNTFGANRIVLADYGLAEQTYELNVRAAQIARRAATAYDTPAQPRYVAGSVGPGTRLVSLRQTSYDQLLASYLEQMRGLLAGGVDLIMIETCQDILQAKAAIHAARLAFERCARRVPLAVLVTIETSGAMLVGTELPAALAAIEAFPEVDIIGLNCATGPQEMSAHVRFLAGHCSRYVAILPNAGIPALVDGEPLFPLGPAELAHWLREFVEVDGVNIVGGCCGTTPAHLAAAANAIRGNYRVKDEAADDQRGDDEGRVRCADHDGTDTARSLARASGPVADAGGPPVRTVDRGAEVRIAESARRTPVHEPSISSLYFATAMRQETSCLLIGERCNTNGSRKFKRLLAEGDLDGLVEMALQQVREGAHVLDVCVDFVGRDGSADMQRVIDRFAREVSVPLMLDSTQPEVIEAGLKLAGGKCIVNSVNLEDGEQKLAHIARLLRQYGAAVVALTIDENPQAAMAKTAARKLEIARRIHGLLTRKYGIREEDIFFDCLTFPITTGNAADRRLALETLDGVAAVSAAFPKCQLSLGISNVSFGLPPAARVVLNSAFLAEARARGLTAAIVHAGGILPQNRIGPQRWQAALDLIYDRPQADGTRLERFASLFADGEQLGQAVSIAELPLEQRLRQRIIDGNRLGLEADLDEALRQYAPVDIINKLLLEGMQTVGELFGGGQMQLPFVLKSAETMKAAVGYLEPQMARTRSRPRGSIVLATVRGDVHDIGKNLVDIILSNNGYEVYNLGIKQPITRVIEAWQEHRADAIGLSGLLVKSTLVMRDDLQVLNEHGITVPVILGGAALNRRYVEDELRKVYGGPVYYARDAFEGLKIMRKITERPAVLPGKPPVRVSAAATVGERRAAAGEVSALEFAQPVPQPPFWGDRVIAEIPLRAILPYVNEVALFQAEWQFRRRGRDAEEFERYIEQKVRPIYRDLVARCERELILRPQVAYGYWPCNSAGDDLIVYAPPAADGALPDAHGPELLRFSFPRQHQSPHRCLADFWLPLAGGVADVVAFSLVTVGGRVGEVAAELFSAGKFQDYLFLYGLAAETAEALAEYVHKQVRTELGIAGHDARDLHSLFRKGYQGCRYSFGYPACPALEDQALLMKLLRPERIGVSLSERFQLEPEQSTSAMIAYHPQARYFNVR